MKRSAWLTFGVLGLAAVPVACFSSTSSPGPDDSGTLPQEDSSPPAEDSGPPPAEGGPGPAESGVTDAGVDAEAAVEAAVEAAAVDAGPPLLTLRVLLAGTPEPGINVVFQDGTGAVVATATTDGTGTVTQLVTAGSQVTALLGTPGAPNPVTIQGVAPGDVLTVADTLPQTSWPGQTVAVTLPAPTWDAAGINELVYAGSCYNPVPYALYLNAGCQSGGLFPLLVSAETSAGQEVAYTYQLGNVALPDGGLPDGATSLPVSISNPWQTSTATATVTSTNPPGLPVDGGTTSTASAVSLSYYEVAEGISFSVPSAAGATADDAGAQTETFGMHPGYPDFVQGEALDVINLSNVLLVAGAATRAASQTSSMSMSFDLSTLPLITSASVDTADGGAAATPTVTWTSAGSLAAANGIYVSAQWSSTVYDDAGIPTYTNGTWTILAPPTATSVTAPSLPTPLAAWTPASTARYNMPRVAAVQASFVSGYAGFRAAFGALPLLSNYAITPPTLPVSGTVHLVGIYPNEG